STRRYRRIVEADLDHLLEGNARARIEAAVSIIAANEYLNLERAFAPYFLPKDVAIARAVGLELARAGKIRTLAGCDHPDGCSSGGTKRDRASAISQNARAANMRSPAGKRFGAKLPRACAQISRDSKHPSFAFVHDRDFRCPPNQAIW